MFFLYLQPLGKINCIPSFLLFFFHFFFFFVSLPSHDRHITLETELHPFLTTRKIQMLQLLYPNGVSVESAL
jgi:hypothetical protein